MTIRLRTAFFILLTILGLWFLYIERAVLTPFILGAIFAYLVTPIVNFFNRRAKIPRIIAIIFVYSVIVGVIVFIGMLVTRRVVSESYALRTYTVTVVDAAKTHAESLPDWMQSFVTEARTALIKSRIFSPEYLFSLFPQALSRIVSFIIFLFSGFYFLKEGDKIFDNFLARVPKPYRGNTKALKIRLNNILSGYLRGQLFLVIFVASVLFIFLSILGVHFALVLAIFTGFAEIVPIIGPITATTISALVVLATGVANFGLAPVEAALIVVIVFFIVRQIQDYFVTPYVMGKITELHPLVILFAVVAGEHIWGILGLILAVPIAAIVKIFLEYAFDVIEVREKKA